MYFLKDKVAIITGSGRAQGIGEAIALRLAEEGCHIVISDLGQPQGKRFDTNHIGTTAEMEAIATKIREKGVKVLCFPCDVRKPAEMEQLIQQTVQQLGRVDIFVNNAGVGYLMELVTEMSPETWDAVLDVNLKGAFLGIQYAARQMIAQKQGGRIINIGSQASKSGFPYAAAYVASKHGLIGLTRAAAIELGQHGITVNTVCPNHITTGLGDWQNRFFSEKLGLSYEQYMQNMQNRIPLGRAGLVTDIAKAVSFLASDQAAYVTGEAMNVSGGEEYH